MTWWGRIVALGIAGLIAACTALAVTPALAQEGPDAPPPSVVQPALPDVPDAPPVAPPSAPPATPTPDPDPPPSAGPTEPSGGGEEPAPEEEAGPTPEEIAAQEAEEAAAEARRQAAIQRRRELAAARARAAERIEGRVRTQVASATSATLSAVVERVDAVLPAPREETSTAKEGLFIGVALVAWLLLIAAFAALERRGGTVSVVMTLLAVALVDVTLYPSANDIEGGLFNPGAGGLTFSLLDILIAAALIAHVVVGKPLRSTFASAWWLAFIAWIGVATLVGLINGHALPTVLFSTRVILYIGLLFLAASVPVDEYLGRRGLPRMIVAATVVALICIAGGATGVSRELSLPGLPGAQIGQLGADGASLLAAIGVIALALAVTRSERRGVLAASGLVLLGSTIFAIQRAALIGVGMSLLVLAIAWFTTTGRRRWKVTAFEAVVAGLCIVAVALVGTMAIAAQNRTDPSIPGVSTVQETFFRQGKQSSADSRVNQWAMARELFPESPIIGQGMGFTYQFYAPGPRETVTTHLTHNIGFDLLLRTGLIGLGLFVIAVLLTVVETLRVWVRSARDDVASLALACVAVMVALLSKGAVESIFEKYRLMTLFGVILGVAASTVLSRAAVASPAARWAAARAPATPVVPPPPPPRSRVGAPVT